MTPPFSAVSKSCDPPSVFTPLPPGNFWQVSNAMFLLMSKFKMIGMLLNVVHDQVQKS